MKKNFIDNKGTMSSYYIDNFLFSKKKLISVALLYIIGALCESLWFVVLSQNFDSAKNGSQCL